MAVATDAGADLRLEGWMDALHGEPHGHLTGMLGDSDEAEDVLQEAWLTAHSSPPAAARANVYQGLNKLRAELSGKSGEEAGS